MAKHYVELKEDSERPSVDQYNEEIDAAMKRMDNGQFYTHEEAIEASKSWLNGK